MHLPIRLNFDQVSEPHHLNCNFIFLFHNNPTNVRYLQSPPDPPRRHQGLGEGNISKMQPLSLPRSFSTANKPTSSYGKSPRLARYVSRPCRPLARAKDKDTILLSNRPDLGRHDSVHLRSYQERRRGRADLNPGIVVGCIPLPRSIRGALSSWWHNPHISHITNRDPSRAT